MQNIAHVFPSYEKAIEHLRSIWDEQSVSEIDRTNIRWKTRDGKNHLGFVVREKDDAARFLAYEFIAYEIHDGFERLPPDDMKLLQGFLNQRVRYVPERA